MTLKEFRELTQNLNENLELIFNSPLHDSNGHYKGSIHIKINDIRLYPDEEKLKEILYLE